MKKIIVLSLAALVCSLSYAQQPQGQRPQGQQQRPQDVRNDKIGVGMTPTMSEYWSPKPKVVTPGNQATAGAPSDAIVLFDGTEKSMTDNWVTKNMRTQEVKPAKWIVKDGVMTVKTTRTVVAISKPRKSLVAISFTSNGAYQKWMLSLPARPVVTVVFITRTCMRCRFSTAITTILMLMV